MEDYTYIDRDGTEIQCASKAEYNRRWRDRYLEDGGLSYQKLIDLKGQTVTLQIHGGKYFDQNADDKSSIEISNLFLPLQVQQIVVEMDDFSGGLEAEFAFANLTLLAKGSHKLFVLWVGFIVFPEHILDDNDEATTYRPTIEVQATSDQEWDNRNSDLYKIEASILLPNGEVIGE